MPAPFSDISLYLPAAHPAGTPAYRDAICLQNYISDLYCKCMNGYKPPYCSRITIQPHYYGIWKAPWKNGSMIAMAPFFDSAAFEQLNKPAKYLCLLNLIQECMLQLSNGWHWDRAVFEKAYQQVIDRHFLFCFNYPVTLSRNRKIAASLIIEKTERITSVYASIVTGNETIKAKLYEKTNNFWHDCSYILVRHAKWFDADRFGIHYPKGKIAAWYSLIHKTVTCIQDDTPVDKIDFKKSFWMQPDWAV